MNLFTYVKNKIMGFASIFKDDNSWNEKTVIGFMSFAVMTVFAAADIITGMSGKSLVIQDTIFNSFVIITVSSLGIAEAGKIFGGKK